MSTPRGRAGPVAGPVASYGHPASPSYRQRLATRSQTPTRLPVEQRLPVRRTPSPAARLPRPLPSSTPLRPTANSSSVPGYASIQARLQPRPPQLATAVSYGRQHLLAGSLGVPVAPAARFKSSAASFSSSPAPAHSSPLALPSASNVAPSIAPSLDAPPKASPNLFSSSLYSTASSPKPPPTLSGSSSSLHSVETARASRLAPDDRSESDREPSFAVERKPSKAAPPASLPQGYGGPGRGLVGLNNLGNTCFMNAAVQCLAFSLPLAAYFLSGHHERDRNLASPARGSLAQAFAELLGKMWGGGSFSSVAPRAFKEQVGRWAPRFTGYNQQDAHEFARFLLDGLHEDVNRAPAAPRHAPAPPSSPDGERDEAKAARHWARYAARNESAIVDLFCGQLKSSIECGSCGHVSTVFDPFLDLSVPIPKDHEERGSFRRTSPPKACSLADCFRAFTERETLSGDEAYRCSRCRAPRTAHKSLTLHRLPPLLVVHIKRFTYSGSLREKLSTDISFPLSGFDLSRFTSPGEPSALYDLYAAACHQGSLSGGHYYAYCLHQEDNKWYSFNDSSVESVSSSSIRGPSAYLLFFQRRR